MEIENKKYCTLCGEQHEEITDLCQMCFVASTVTTVVNARELVKRVKWEK